MPRIYTTITDEFHLCIEGYAKHRNITLAAAMVELASIGYSKAYHTYPLKARAQWGGSPRNRPKVELKPEDIDAIEARLEEIESSLMNLPHLEDNEK